MIFIDTDVWDYLERLSQTMYTKGYFGFPDSAKQYTDKIVDYAVYYIPILTAKQAPERFKRYGWPLFYITYRPNKTTNWYIFYMKSGNRYLGTYITNNHVNAQHIRGLR